MGSVRRFLGVWPRSRPLPGSVDRSRGRGGVPAVHVRRRWCRPASMLPWWGLVHTSSPLLEVRFKIAQPTADQDNSPKFLCRRSDVVDNGVLDRFDLKYLNACGVATSYVGGRQNIFSSQPVSAVTTPLADAVSPSARGRLEIFTITPPGNPGISLRTCRRFRGGGGGGGGGGWGGGGGGGGGGRAGGRPFARRGGIIRNVCILSEGRAQPATVHVTFSRLMCENRVDARMSFAGRRRRSPSR